MAEDDKITRLIEEIKSIDNDLVAKKASIAKK